MTLLYFDGFDLNTRILSGLDVGAGSMQDAGHYWRGGTITRYDFPVGYQEGRSFRVTTSGTNDARGINLGGIVGRVGMWAAWNSSTRSLDILRMSRPDFSARVVSNTNGSISLIVDGVQYATGAVLDSSDDWAYYEFFGDAENGVYSLHKNGFPVWSVTGVPGILPTRALVVGLGNPSLNSAPNYRVDHFWVTDGPFPEGDEILGVQVVAAADRYESSSAGFVGSLVIGGARYESGFQGALVMSQAPYAQGLNLVNVLGYRFSSDPSSGLPWSRDRFASIEKWGLCYVPRLDSAKQRIVGLLLATLEYNNGRPLVVNRPVGGSVEFSGPWTRSDNTKSFAWHLQESPRQFILRAEDTPSVYADGPGCLLFPGPAEVPNPVRPDFTDVGITFAEEFREDYTDWVKIDGVGANYDSSFVSGYGIYGDGNRKFQSNYVTVNYEHVPTGGAYIQGLWDYTTDPDTGRWSMKQNVYKQEDGFKHGTRRLKIRGHGKTLQLRISSKPGQPFKVNGWTIMVTSNTSV